jgi:hypothetical protein
MKLNIPGIIVLLLSLSVFGTQTILTVPYVMQLSDNTCWAADCKMVLNYYQYNTAYTEIWNYGTQGDDVATDLCFDADPYYSAGSIIDYFGSIAYNCADAGTVPFSTLNTDIATYGEPIVAVERLSSRGHGVVIMGVDPANSQILYADPDAAYGGEFWDGYSHFCSNSTWYWSGYLEMQDSPPGWVVGVLSYVTITSGPTAFTDPAGASTYTSQFINSDNPPAYAGCWNWALKFEYAGGEYTAISSGSINCNQNSSQWYTAAFSLPSSGYTWVRNQNGLVMGQVRVSTTDNDGVYHSAYENVTYAKQPLIPDGKILENVTISNAAPEVDVHHCIIADTLNVQSGGSVTLKAGTCITIYNNMTVSNGGALTLTIDPTLQ